jgi:hypothetical protein
MASEILKTKKQDLSFESFRVSQFFILDGLKSQQFFSSEAKRFRRLAGAAPKSVVVAWFVAPLTDS